MKKDMLTAGDNMKVYENDGYPGFTTKGGFIGSSFGGGIGKIIGTVSTVTGGSFIGSTIGSSIGKSIGEYFDPLRSYPAIKVP